MQSLLRALCLVPACAFAGTYGPQPFTKADGTATLGDNTQLSGTVAGLPSVQSNALRLTADGVGGTLSSFKLPDLDAGRAISELTVNFDLKLKADGNPADGFAITFGNLPGDNGGGEAGFAGANSLTVAWDTYDNGGDPPSIEAYANQLSIRNELQSFVYDTTFRPVVIHWDANGLDVTHGGTVIMSDVPTPGFVPGGGNRLGFSARTGGATEEVSIDNLRVTTLTPSPIETGGPVISEFLASNKEGAEDDFLENSDFIELYNGANSSVNYNGWFLTDDPEVLNKWRMPALTAGAYTYLRVWADGRNLIGNLEQLHTNFSLSADGGFVALVKPDGVTVASSFAYGTQADDVSYGTLGMAQTPGYLSTPTPGLPNSGAQATNPPSFLDVEFSRNGGLISAAVALELTPSAELPQGAQIRYTLNESTPTLTNSTLYTGPIAISTKRTVRARVFETGGLPGPVSSRTFLWMDASLTNYRGTGQPFSSNLPVIVLDSHGVDVDASNNSAPGARPYRPTYAVAIDRDPSQGNRARLDGPVDYQGRGSTRVRGESSAGFPQRQYAWETWDNEDRDKDESVLGFPADSDWVLYAPYTDKTLMRNFLIYSMMRELNGNSAGMGVKFVEVFFNQDGGNVGYQDYRGVYVLVERIKRGSQRVNIQKMSPVETDPARLTGGYLFKKDKVSQDVDFSLNSGQVLQLLEPEAQVGQTAYNWIQNYMNQFEAALNGPSFSDPAAGYAAFIEPQTFMDNHIWVEMAKQIDGYRLSSYFHKDRGGRVKAQPVWDYNLSLGNADYLTGENPIGWYYSQIGGGDYPWYDRLFQDAAFALGYRDRWWALRRGILKTDSLMARIDGLADQLTDGSAVTITNGTGSWPNSTPSAQTPAARHNARWQILGTYVWPNAPGFDTRTTWQSEISTMKTWWTQRLAWMDTQLGTAPAFSAYGGSFPAAQTLTITNPAGGGTIYYTTDGTDPYDNSAAAVNLIGSRANAAADPIACRWLVPTAGNGGQTLTAGAGANQWTTFTDPPNLAQWQSGNLGIGYERSPGDSVNYTSYIGAGSDTQSAMHGVNGSCYLRVTFNIDSQAALDSFSVLTLGMRYDDGFLAYLNGAKIAERNPFTTGDPWNAVTATIHDDPLSVNYEDIDVSAFKSFLRIGKNVLAIHGLNGANNTSSDFLMFPRLIGSRAGGASPTALAYTAPVAVSATAEVKARVLSAGVWSPLTKALFIIGAVPASAQNLVVSEFLYHPTNPAPAGAESAWTDDKVFEWITLRNISAVPVDLTGVNFDAGITFAFSGEADDLLLLPGREIVVSANPQAWRDRYGDPPAAARLVGPWTGSLSNEGERIRLLNAAGAKIREFKYEITAPWPADANEGGYSLVLIRPADNPDHANPMSWRTGAAVNGTPAGSDGPVFAGSWPSDTDGDGQSDGLEWALGSAANNASSVPVAGFAFGEETVGEVTGNFLRVTFDRSLARDNTDVVPEISTDLNEWRSAAFVRLEQLNKGNGTATETWRSLAPVSGPRVYARLRVRH